MSRPRRRGGGHEEEHENHERWLVSYADMITVLMALFIVLFAISQVDQQKFVELRASLMQGFGENSSIPVSGGTGLLASSGVAPDPIQLNSGAGSGVAPAERFTTEDAEANRIAASAELDRLQAIRQQMQGALEQQGLGDRVQFRITERGLIAAVIADDVFFANASAELQPTGRQVLQAVAPTIRRITQEVEVEGHANHLRMTGSQYPTNWELSTARAASVVRWLAEHGVEPRRLVAAGFGDTRPLYPVDDPRALNGNRRVDLVITSDRPSEVRALLPLLAGVSAG